MAGSFFRSDLQRNDATDIIIPNTVAVFLPKEGGQKIDGLADANEKVVPL